MGFDEFFEYVVMGGIVVLVVAVFATLVFGLFSKSELYSTISSVVLGALAVVAVLALIGYFFLHHVFEVR